MTSKYDPPTTPARTSRGSPSPTSVKPIVEKSPKVHDLRNGKCCVIDPETTRALANVDQPVLVTVGKWPQQHSPNQGEYCGVGSDAERERDHNGNGKPPRIEERPEGEFDISQEGHDSSLESRRVWATLNMIVAPIPGRDSGYKSNATARNRQVQVFLFHSRETKLGRGLQRSCSGLGL